MRSVRWGVAAAVAALLGVEPRAADAQPEARDPLRFLLFSGADLWRAGAFTHAGLLWSPGGLANEGFTFKLLLGGGAYKYHSGVVGGEVTSHQLLAAAMPGWRVKGERFELTVLAGLDLQNHRPDPPDPGSRIAGSHVGIRAGFDLWAEPAAGWMMAGSASASSIGRSYWSRVAVGTRVLGRVWMGPEALAMGDDEYRQFRLGAHLTGFRTGEYEWSAGLGWVMDSDERSGFYARAGVLTRR